MNSWANRGNLNPKGHGNPVGSEESKYEKNNLKRK